MMMMMMMMRRMMMSFFSCFSILENPPCKASTEPGTLCGVPISIRPATTTPTTCPHSLANQQQGQPKYCSLAAMVENPKSHQID